MEKTCKTCRNYAPSNVTTGRVDGLCRGGLPNANHHNRWPPVSSEVDWCGQHKGHGTINKVVELWKKLSVRSKEGCVSRCLGAARRIKSIYVAAVTDPKGLICRVIKNLK